MEKVSRLWSREVELRWTPAISLSFGDIAENVVKWRCLFCSQEHWRAKNSTESTKDTCKKSFLQLNWVLIMTQDWGKSHSQNVERTVPVAHTRTNSKEGKFWIHRTSIRLLGRVSPYQWGKIKARINAALASPDKSLKTRPKRIKLFPSNFSISQTMLKKILRLISTQHGKIHDTWYAIKCMCGGGVGRVYGYIYISISHAKKQKNTIHNGKKN